MIGRKSRYAEPAEVNDRMSALAPKQVRHDGKPQYSSSRNWERDHPSEFELVENVDELLEFNSELQDLEEDFSDVEGYPVVDHSGPEDSRSASDRESPSSPFDHGY